MPEDVHSARIEKLRNKMKSEYIEAVLIEKKENIFYFSGFSGTAGYLLITQDKQFLITDFRYVQQALSQAPVFKVLRTKNNYYVFLNDMLKELGIKKLGFEGNYVPYDKFKKYSNKIDETEFTSIGYMVEKIRVVKSPDEVKIIKKAVEIADNTFNHIIEYIKPGVREIEIAAEIEYSMKKQGASGPSFETIVASGYRSSLPHGTASEKLLEKNDAVTLDYGAVYKGYCSDFTRTVFLGEPSSEMAKIYDIVKNAQRQSVKRTVKGILGKQADQVARDIISRQGYGDYFGHGLGHGVGIEVHEEPRLSPKSLVLLENGMTVTVEPGIYIKDTGGVRIEDLILINNDKPIVLTRSTRDMIIL